MLEGGRITYKQMILLICISRAITWVSFLPIIQAPPANQDVWLGSLMALPVYLVVILPVYLLAKRFPQQTLYEYSQTIAGKVGQWVIAILYILFFIHAGAFALSLFSGFITTNVMHETPVLFFVITFTLSAAYAVHHGIEVFGRLSEFFAPIIMIAVIGAILFLVKDVDLKELQPVLETGIYPLFLTGLSPVSETIEIIGLAIILPFLNDAQKAKRVYLLTPLLLGFFLLLITTLAIGLFGDDLAKIVNFPFYRAVRMVQVGDFIERIETFHVAIWVLGMFIKIALYYYLAVLGLGQLVHLKTYKPLILPMGTILVSLAAVIGSNYVEFREFYSFENYTWYSMFFIFFIPTLLLLIALIRKKGERTK